MSLSQPLHPYIDIWIHCRQYATAMSGMPAFPESGAWFDQDAELMLAFDLLNDIYGRLQKEAEDRKKNQALAKPQHIS